jgi:hypothetical protein
MLQASTPDNDILVYWPIHDFWHNSRGLREAIRVHNADRWFHGTSLGRAAEWLDEGGFAFDYVSDRLLAKCEMKFGRIVAPGASYTAILVPQAKYMPTATLEKLRDLAQAGGKIIFWGDLPVSAPGLISSQEQSEFDAARAAFVGALGRDISAPLGQGRVIAGSDLIEVFSASNVPRELFRTEAGIQFVRRQLPDSVCYFLYNADQQPIDAWIRLGEGGRSAAIMDPMTGKIGRAELKNGLQIRLQLARGQSIFVRTFDTDIAIPEWQYVSPASDAIPILGDWNIEFIAGGPSLPAASTRSDLASWTTFDPPTTDAFAGTAAYIIKFDAPAEGTERFLLDLGDVRDSARVILNGQEMATLISPPYRVPIGPLRATGNELRVEVTNVAANRIRDLDRRGVRWRIFHDINLVNINYRPFNASDWPIREAGLLGPVTLRPLK